MNWDLICVHSVGTRVPELQSCKMTRRLGFVSLARFLRQYNILIRLSVIPLPTWQDNSEALKLWMTSATSGADPSTVAVIDQSTFPPTIPCPFYQYVAYLACVHNAGEYGKTRTTRQGEIGRTA
jgi:hypothetical protein